MLFRSTYLPEHDALVGRGVEDNKGPAIAGLFVMRMLRDLEIPMRHGVKLYCGMSEENGMDDMKTLVARGERFLALSIVPDAGFPVNYAQKGSFNVDLTARAEGNLRAIEAGNAYNIIPDRAECVLDADIDAVRAAVNGLDEALRGAIAVEAAPEGVKLVSAGRAGHAAGPDGSVNAIHVLARALTEADLLTGSARDAVRGLELLARDAYAESEGAAFEDEASGRTTLVYTLAHFAEGALTIGGDCRFSISCDSDQLLDKLKAAWALLGYTPVKLTVSQPFYMTRDDARVQALQEIYRTLTGRDEPPYAMGGGTYSRVVPNAISFGPGMPGENRVSQFMPEGHGYAHGRDETLVMEKIYDGAKIYLAAMAVLDDIV